MRVRRRGRKPQWYHKRYDIIACALLGAKDEEYQREKWQDKYDGAPRLLEYGDFTVLSKDWYNNLAAYCPSMKVLILADELLTHSIFDELARHIEEAYDEFVEEKDPEMEIVYLPCKIPMADFDHKGMGSVYFRDVVEKILEPYDPAKQEGKPKLTLEEWCKRCGALTVFMGRDRWISEHACIIRLIKATHIREDLLPHLERQKSLKFDEYI